jgi:hypothetical protein
LQPEFATHTLRLIAELENIVGNILDQIVADKRAEVARAK